MDKEEYSEYLTDLSSAEDFADGYHAIGQHGHSILGRLVRHGQVWFVKSYDCGTDIKECELRLQKEFEILVKLNHPGIVRAGWLETLPDIGPSIVMEYINGERLDEFLTHASRRQRYIISESILHTVAYMHSRGVVHLDLKPQNIMVSGKGELIEIKIIDFGISQSSSSVMFRHSGGTRSFSDPQQFKAGYEANPNSDVYALGKLLEQINGGNIFRILAKLAVKENPSDRPADGNSLLAIKNKISKSIRHAIRIAIFATLIGALYCIFTTNNKNTSANTDFNINTVVSADSMDNANIAYEERIDTGAQFPKQISPSELIEDSPKETTQENTIESEYNRLTRQWTKELEVRASRMERVVGQESISKEERRAILLQMNDSIIYDTQEFFRPFIEKQEEAVVRAHSLSWGSIHEPAFQQVRQRMKIAYERLND